jgi:hypothetical protein
MPKILYVMFIGLFFLILINDIMLINGSYIKIERAVGQAIDSGIIEGTEAEDYQRGYVRLDEAKARLAAREILIDTLKLNPSLENDLFKKSDFDFKLTYLGDTPRIEAEFLTEVSFVAGKLFGVGTFPISIKKKTPYLTEFK